MKRFSDMTDEEVALLCKQGPKRDKTEAEKQYSARRRAGARSASLHRVPFLPKRVG